MKKIYTFLCVVVLALLITPSVNAKEYASLPSFDITFNGNKIDSTYRQYPILVYKDITYFPMTYFDSRHLGLITEWDNDTRTLYINKDYISAAFRNYNWEARNSATYEVEICDFNIFVSSTNINNIEEEYPLLTFRDVTYFPITWRFANDMFHWEYEFSNENGLSVKSSIQSELITLPYLDGVFAQDENFYYYIAYKDGRQSIFRADINNTQNYISIYDLPENYYLDNGKCTVWLEMDMGTIYFKYHIGGATMGSNIYVKINSDGTATEEAPKNYLYSKFGDSIYYKTDGKISVTVKNFFQSPAEFTYTVNNIEHTAQMHPDNPHIEAYQDGKIMSDSVKPIELVQILGENIYFVGRSPAGITESALYCIDTHTGETTKIIENVGAFHVYRGLGEEYFTGWGYREATKEDISDNVIFDRGGKLLGYNIKTGVETEIAGCAEGKLITSFGSRQFIAQQNLETRTDSVTMFGVPANMQLYNKVILSTHGGAQMYRFGDSFIYKLTSELPEDKVRLAVFFDVGYLYFSDVALDVFVNDETVLYSFGEKETIAKIKF